MHRIPYTGYTYNSWVRKTSEDEYSELKSMPAGEFKKYLRDLKKAAWTIFNKEHRGEIKINSIIMGCSLVIFFIGLLIHSSVGLPSLILDLGGVLCLILFCGSLIYFSISYSSSRSSYRTFVREMKLYERVRKSIIDHSANFSEYQNFEIRKIEKKKES